MITATAVIVGCFCTVACAAPAPETMSAGSWNQLAAAHDPQVCARCRPVPPVAASVAEVVRRIRQPAAAPPSAPAGSIDVAADLRHVAAVAPDDQSRQAMRIADERVRADVKEAAGFAAALPPGHVQDSALLVVMYVWTLRDRPAALAWALALPDEGTRAAALNEVTRRLVSAHPQEALALVSALPEGPGREDALCSVARHWAKIDRIAALSWARGLADGPTKTRILSSPDFATETE
jgi:hypothetical protein